MGNARRLKHLFGGAMRQAGIVAAAAVYASITTSTGSPTITRAPGGSRSGWPPPDSRSIPTDGDELRPDRHRAARTKRGRDRAPRRAGRRSSATIRPDVLRAVTHLDVDDEDIDGALEAIPKALGARVGA